MGRRLEVTNLGLGPRGWPEIGQRKPTILKRGETKTLEVEDNVALLLVKMSEGERPDVELVDHGPMQGQVETAIERALGTFDLRGASISPEADANLAEIEASITTARDDLLAAQGALEAKDAAIAERDLTIQRQAEEIEQLMAPKTFTVGPFVTAALAAAGIENFEDLQSVLNAIEAAAQSTTTGAETPADPSVPNSAETGASEVEKPGNTGSETGAEPDHFDAMDDDALRAFIKAQTQKDPHPAAKRETLLKKAREADAGEAV